MKTLLYLSIWFILTSCNTVSEPAILDPSDPNLILENGVLLRKKKPFEGQLQQHFENGVMQSSITYKKGRKNGVERQWYNNNQLAVERYYTQGTKTGTHRGWWPNTNPKFEYNFDLHGAYHGEIIEWYTEGQQYKSFHYTHGKEIGSQKLWKQSGAIKANYEVRNGERFGLIGLKKCFTVKTDSNEIK